SDGSTNSQNKNKDALVDRNVENQTNTHAGLQDTEKAEEEVTHTYVLFPVLSDGSTNSQNKNKDALVDRKEHDDDIRKSVSPDIYSSSSGAQTRKQGDKTENKDKGKSPVTMNYHPVLAENQTNSNAGFQDTEKAGEEGTHTYVLFPVCGDQTRKQGDKAENKDKGKSHVVTITGFRDLNEEFTECINNSSNEINAAGSSVSTAGLNSTNNTNEFSATGPSNAAMPNLEDLSYNADDFRFVYEQEPSYNQNYDDNYYPHESLSFPCCDYCGGSHETFQCQPDNQNDDFSSSNQIQTLQYPDVNLPSPEISNEEIFQAKGDLMKSIQTFLERFNCIPFEEKPQILFQTWETFFAIQCSQPEVSNELFQKLLKDLKELAEYDQSTRTDRPIFLNDNEDHPVQNRESPENSSEENVVSKTNQEPPQDSDIHQLIEECSVEVPEEQKQNMEKMMFDLVKICHHKQFLCIHDDVDDLIESALDSKILSINSINSQRLNKKEQEVKKVVEQPAERRNRAEKSLHNFRVVHKSSISFKNTSQISSIHSIAPIQSTKEHEHLLSMGYEHPSITPETESDEVTESNAENLLPIPSKCKVTSEDEIDDDESLPDEDVPEEEFKIYSNPLCDEDEINSDKLDPHYFNVESDFVESLLNRDTFIDFSSKFDFSELNAEIADTIIESIPLPILVQDGNSQQEEIDIVTKIDDVLPPSDDNDDDLSNDSLLGEADLFLSDDSIPPGIENVADDPEGDICFLEELLINDSILSHESFDSSFEDNSSISRPPPKPPDDELDLEPDSGKHISAVVNKDVSDDENDDYFHFMLVIRFFLPYFIFFEISPLLLSTESEDTIFDPGISE
nr:hypothetical protein [Tanacetum cinerariifolium]